MRLLPITDLPFTNMKFVDLQIQAAECLAQDKYAEAVALYAQCIEANPLVLSNYWKLGLAWVLQGEELEGQACWLSAIVEGDAAQVDERTEELIKVLEAEALERLESGKYEQAEKIYLQIIEQHPNHSVAYKNLGNAVFNQGKLEEAIAYYQQGLTLDPDDAITYYHLAIVFQQQEKLEEAIAYYQQFLTLNPNSAAALNNMGQAFQAQGKLEEAIACYQQALTLDPSDALTYNNLGTALQAQGKLEEAIACFQQGIVLEPNNAIAHNNLGLRFLKKHDFEKAIASYNRAIEIDPDYVEANWNRALLLLQIGDYKRGFAEYEWRWRREKTPARPFAQPLWDGSTLESGTILLHAEQGFGDTIQFIRYAPLVAQLVGHVIVECHQPLVKLLTTVTAIEKVVARETTLPEFDVQAPLLSLPYILGTTLETLPAQIPYLSPLEPLSVRLETPPETCRKVGIVWAGNPEHPDDRNRSCSLNHFASLLNTPGAAFYSLQKGPSVAELAQFSCQVPLQDLSSQLHDFADTAAVIDQLDLIVSIDTSVAHLAGALGKPVWLLLSFSHDWRWMSGRDDSPWYPSMRLFRQNRSGDWEDVLRRVTEALLKLTDADFSD
ncbi:tetratricopeptide repeat protein [Argonema galeatum]|uniref:tetratricopeptide repeat protein n=1 Tax=Argonema galeatum TaxID=2942762 RepID=UPI0020111425|nr:tetratricopeptide repeat protein [Argonema galeatum]MCL1466815.1 tetratricopeptide repeat protein [Argonema galeatum A003/A1]